MGSNAVDGNRCVLANGSDTIKKKSAIAMDGQPFDMAWWHNMVSCLSCQRPVIGSRSRATELAETPRSETLPAALDQT
jgi:hypothetical protein